MTSRRPPRPHAANPPRWPNLKFDRIGAFEHVDLGFEKDLLLQLAAVLDSGQAVSSLQRYIAAECLRQIASKPAALRALNRAKSRPPRRAIGVNRAAHYLVRSELRGKGNNKRALGDVATVWSTSPNTVQDDVTDFRAVAQREIEALMRLRSVEPHKWDRRRVLEALDADLRIQANGFTTGRKK
jgi:hypothetical protein